MTHFPAENRFRNALRHQNETTNANRSCASDPVSNAKILIFHVVSKFDGKTEKKGIIFKFRIFAAKKVFITYISFQVLLFFVKGKTT